MWWYYDAYHFITFTQTTYSAVNRHLAGMFPGLASTAEQIKARGLKHGDVTTEDVVIRNHSIRAIGSGTSGAASPLFVPIFSFCRALNLIAEK